MEVTANLYSRKTDVFSESLDTYSNTGGSLDPRTTNPSQLSKLATSGMAVPALVTPDGILDANVEQPYHLPSIFSAELSASTTLDTESTKDVLTGQLDDQSSELDEDELLIQNPQTAFLSSQIDSSALLQQITNGVFEVVSSDDETFSLVYEWIDRQAEFDNEVGVYLVDADGKVDGIAPGEPGYELAAIDSTSRKVVFRSGQDAGAQQELSFATGERLAFYIIQNATSDRWISQNPENFQGGGPLAFFSLPDANPNGFNHVQISQLPGSKLTLAWEDIVNGGDRDFNDVVFTVSPKVETLPSSGAEFLLAPTSDEDITVEFTWDSREAEFRNELGLYKVDDAQGRIGTLLPGDPGYTEAALAPNRRQVLFESGQTAGASKKLSLSSQEHFGWYLIQNSTTQRFLERNPSNSLNRGPKAFFSYQAANPDNFHHIQRLTDNQLAWEDITNGGDRDFDDLIFSYVFKPSSNPLPSITIDDVTLQEGDVGVSKATFKAQLSAPSDQVVTVDFTTQDDSAEGGEDFLATSGALTFAPGETVKEISVDIIGDTIEEPDESFSVVLSQSVNATLADEQGLGTIQNDDIAVVIDPPAVSITDVVVEEGDDTSSFAEFTLDLSTSSDKEISVEFETQDDSAVAGEDYVAVRQSVVFAPGETSKTVSVEVIADTVVEATETFFVNLRNPTNATLDGGQVTGTIIDNDTATDIEAVFEELEENNILIEAAFDDVETLVDRARTGIAAALNELESIVTDEEIPFTGSAIGSFGLPDPSIQTGTEVLTDVSGGDDNRLTWGNPVFGSFSSYVQFDGQNFDPLSGNNFVLGDLTYGNGQTRNTFDGDFPFELTLNLSSPVAESESFDFVFDILNTPNNTRDPILDGDRLRFSVTGNTRQFFEYNNQDYTLSILGFSPDNGETITNEFNSPEDSVATAALVGRITEGIDDLVAGIGENEPRPATALLARFDEELSSALGAANGSFESLDTAEASLRAALDELDNAIEEANAARQQEDLFVLLDAIERLEVTQEAANQELEQLRTAQARVDSSDTNLKTVAAQFENYVTNIPSAANSFDFDEAAQPLIGIIDTGFSGDSQDLNYNRIILGKDYLDDDGNPLLTPGEGNEHGTHLLGIIAALQNNQVAIDGINDDAPIWLSRAVGSGDWAAALVEFVDAAVASGQPNAIATLGFDLIQQNEDGSIETRFGLTTEEIAALEYARENGVLVVVAAGNEGSRISALGQASEYFDNVITVGAANGDVRASYSSFGEGLDILATGGTDANPVYSLVGDTAGTMRGTSVAVAEVAGAASLVWAANPDISYLQVLEILKGTATDISEPGPDDETGAGLLNLDAAVAAASAAIPVDAPSTPVLKFNIQRFNSASATPLERPAFIGAFLYYLNLALAAYAIIDGLIRAVDVISDTVEANDLNRQADELTNEASEESEPTIRENKLAQARDLEDRADQLQKGAIDEAKVAAGEVLIGLAIQKFRLVERLFDSLSDVATRLFRNKNIRNAGEQVGEFIDDTGRTLSPGEIRAADKLTSEGRIVEALEESTEQGVRTADFLVDGVRTELKTISNLQGTTADALSGGLGRRILDGAGQAPNILVDVTKQSGMTRDIADRAVRRAYGADNLQRIQEVRVIGQDFDFTVPRRQ